MDDIAMTDLSALHAPLRTELDAAFARVLASGSFVLGEEGAAFERETAALLGVSLAVGVSSGSDALLALLMACGIGPGDEVVTTPFSFFATVEAILRLGARPIFADIEPDSFNLDPARAMERIGPRTKAVLVVHLFGRVARMAELREACAAAEIPLLEDAAQAIGARDEVGGTKRPAGAMGRGAALSFFPAKNLGGFGDGGMVITDDQALAYQIRRLRNHGAGERHRHDRVGGNFRLDEIQAALLRVKLPHLVGWTEARRRIAAAYGRQLAETPVILPPPDDGCVWNQFVIRVPAERRTALIGHLHDRGIASAIYYPLPLHLQPALAEGGQRAGAFPCAERASREALALPIFPTLTEEGIARVTGAVSDFFRRTGRSIPPGARARRPPSRTARRRG
jgi:dTDP-4-amino-4,6-dideoxygalactose transaminase